MRYLLIIFTSALYFVIGFQASHTPNLDALASTIVLDIHDPARLIRIDDTMVLFASAVEWRTYNLASQTWQLRGDDIYEQIRPSWYSGNRLWAPSVFESTAGLKLYHSAVEDEDQHRSKIGFASVTGEVENLRFSPSSDYVLASENINQPFAIDPAVFRDKHNRLWLVYGSHARGIWIVELDEETGLLKEGPSNKTWHKDDTRFTPLANYGGQLNENNIEAAYIFNHPNNDYYYLFVNWDECCNGVDSTYNIRVGRSTHPTGPYLDEEGNDLLNGGGTLFLDARGKILGDDRFVGPGHAGVYQYAEHDFLFTHHFYDADNSGEPSLAIWSLDREDDWPVIKQ
jgi:arabinan endo-1,5-alpha-L-arabinosidase